MSFREHDWFKVDIPDYLFPPDSEMDASVIDTEVVREVCEVRRDVTMSHASFCFIVVVFDWFVSVGRSAT